jgi:hypothetical protein
MPVSKRKTKTSSSSSSGKRKTKHICKYDPFCFRTNADHLKQYRHSIRGYNRIILNDEMREKLIDLILHERLYGKNFIFNAVLQLTDKYIDEVKGKKKTDIEAIYSLHVRLQEEASPNQPQLSKISRLL